jgi:hypothetical protein
MGNYYFYNCTALKTVNDNPSLNHEANMLPQLGNYAFAGCTALEYAGFRGGDATIGKYAFAGCSGLKNFYFGLGEAQDGVCSYAEIYDYAFQGCTGIEKIYVLGGATAGQWCTYGKNIFDGWTATQTIVFLNDFRGTGNIAGLPDWNWWYSYYDKAMLDGCEAQIVYQDDLFSTEEVTIDYCGAFGDIYYYGDPAGFNKLASYTNVKVLNIGRLVTSYGPYCSTTLHANAFNGFTADQTINFTYYTYAEFIKLIADGVIDGDAFNNCAAKVCDKDGNVIVIEGGAVTSVTNADGTTVLWTPAT